MSVENVVIFNKKNMVSSEEWQKAISEAGFTLEIDTDFDPLDFSGFLPCRIGDVECGFEYFFEDLDPEATEDLEVPLPADWDTVVTLVTRSSYDDLQASCIAAGVLAHLVKGGFFDGGDEPMINGGQSIESARSILSEIEKLKLDEVSAQEAKQKVIDSGSPEDSLEVLLGSLSGVQIEDFNKGYKSLSVILAGDREIKGDAWRLIGPNTVFDVSRERRIKGLQADLLVESKGNLDSEQKARWSVLEGELDEARNLDASDLAKIATFLTPLDQLSIKSVEWQRPSKLLIRITGQAEFSLEFEAVGLMPELAVVDGPIEYQISVEGVEIF
jgi:hypothetical protein